MSTTMALRADGNNKGIQNNDSVMTVVSAPSVPVQIAQQVEDSDGAKAIEVAAVFDDAVMAVRHLDNPKAGRLSGLTKGALGSAAAALIGVGALFADSYSHVVAEKAAQEAGQTGRRAPSEGRGRDAAAGGLLAFGVGALLFGAQRASAERRENEFSIGSDPNATFQVTAERLPLVRFPLVRSTGSAYEVVFTEGMTGELQAQGKTTSLSQLRESGSARPADGVQGSYAMNIPDGGQLRLAHDNCTFLVRSVARPRHYPVPLRVDWRTQAYTGGVLAGAATLLGIMFSVPPDPRSLALDAFSNEQLVRFMVKPPEQQEELAPWLKQEQKKPEPAVRNGGKAAKGPSGRMGRPDVPRTQQMAYQVKGPKDNTDPKLNAQLAKDLAKDIGVIGVLRNSNIAALTSLMANTSALGNDAIDAMGMLDATQTGDAYGPGGMGIVGVGPGGPGTGDGTIGLGPMGQLGRNGGPPGYGRPGHVAALKKHITGGPDGWSLGQPEIKGSLDRDLIRRVIRQHMNEVKFCYERELTRDASLNGRVTVKFAIGGTGTVTSSVVENSTLGNGGGESCIANAIRRWQFPKPQGGIVIVSYPFVLKPAN